MLRDSIECLRREMFDGFSKIYSEMDSLRHAMKADMKILKEKVREIEKSIEFTQGEVDLLKEDMETKEDQWSQLQQGNEELNRRISELTKKLKEEEEKNIQMKEYTRRENLRFNNIPGIRPRGLQVACLRHNRYRSGDRHKPVFASTQYTV